MFSSTWTYYCRYAVAALQYASIKLYQLYSPLKQCSIRRHDGGADGQGYLRLSTVSSDPRYPASEK